MDRLNCPMINMCGKTAYCDYYDFMYQKCSDVINCPEDLDDDEGSEEDYHDWDDDNFYDTNDTHI